MLHCVFVCLHVCIAWKGRPRNDLYCVGWDVKPYSLTHSLITQQTSNFCVVFSVSGIFLHRLKYGTGS